MNIISYYIIYIYILQVRRSNCLGTLHTFSINHGHSSCCGDALVPPQLDPNGLVHSNSALNRASEVAGWGNHHHWHIHQLHWVPWLRTRLWLWHMRTWYQNHTCNWARSIVGYIHIYIYWVAMHLQHKNVNYLYECLTWFTFRCMSVSISGVTWRLKLHKLQPGSVGTIYGWNHRFFPMNYGKTKGKQRVKHPGRDQKMYGSMENQSITTIPDGLRCLL